MKFHIKTHQSNITNIEQLAKHKYMFGNKVNKVRNVFKPFFYKNKKYKNIKLI